MFHWVPADLSQIRDEAIPRTPRQRRHRHLEIETAVLVDFVRTLWIIVNVKLRLTALFSGDGGG